MASMRLLDGIHDEAVDLLKDKNITSKAVRLLKRVSGIRQIVIAELMVTANNFSTGYAEALVLGTPKDQRVNPDEPKKKRGISPEEIARMEQEMESLERDLKGVEESYGENMLVLTVARGYIKKLLENPRVLRFLNANYGEICAEFQAIAAAESV
jgi:RepB plasmid partitioning protein